MAKITRKGRELAWKFNPVFGTTHGIDETFSLIARHAATYQRLAEQAANSPGLPLHMLDAYQEELDNRIAQVGARLESLIEDLPSTDNGDRLGIDLQGDPRGFVVKIILPQQLIEDGIMYGNTWGDNNEFGIA